MSANIYFTSDTHFGHGNIIRYCGRPFSSVEEMDEHLIKQWNEKIRDEDIVHHLGDFSIRCDRNILKRLRGEKFLISGSHDKLQSSNEDIWKEIVPQKMIRVNGKGIFLCHYAMRVWPESHYNSWHLYGHSHGRLPSHGWSLDVGVDTNAYCPYSMEDIMRKMKELKELGWVSRN